MSVRLGGLDSPGESSFKDDEFFSVADIHLYSELNRDLAILELTTASDTAPIPLPKASKPMASMEFEGYGYGVSQVPSWVDTTVYDWGKLKKIELFRLDEPAPLDNSDQLLHLASADEGPPCRGDSGGPVIDRGTALAVMIAQVIERPEHAYDEPSTTIQTMAARAFAFTRFNSCGIGSDDDETGEISYIATRLDKPEIRTWVANVLSSPRPPKDTQKPTPKADSLYK
ncbi:MAG TPA: trypsin-like serine protease [Nannocystis exedens]|nr:trypsin-like serine protease [Nannocystis exedens]